MGSLAWTLLRLPVTRHQRSVRVCSRHRLTIDTCLHVFKGPDDFNGCGYFLVRLHAVTVEEYVLASALSEVVFCIEEWSIALGHRLVFLSVTFMTMHLFQFLPVRRSMMSFSSASKVLHVPTSASSREWGPMALTLPTSLASDCSYMSRYTVQMDGGIAYNLPAHTQGTYCKTCAGVFLHELF